MSVASAKQGANVTLDGQLFKTEIMDTKSKNDFIHSENEFDLGEKQTTHDADVQSIVHEQEGSV